MKLTASPPIARRRLTFFSLRPDVVVDRRARAGEEGGDAALTTAAIAADARDGGHVVVELRVDGLDAGHALDAVLAVHVAALERGARVVGAACVGASPDRSSMLCRRSISCRSPILSTGLVHFTPNIVIAASPGVPERSERYASERCSRTFRTPLSDRSWGLSWLPQSSFCRVCSR